MTARFTSIRLDGDRIIMSGILEDGVLVERECSREAFDDKTWILTVRGHLFAWGAAERLFQRLGEERRERGLADTRHEWEVIERSSDPAKASLVRCTLCGFTGYDPDSFALAMNAPPLICLAKTQKSAPPSEDDEALEERGKA